MIELQMDDLVSVDGQRRMCGRSVRVEIRADGRVIGRIEATPHGLAIVLGEGMRGDGFAINVADERSFAMRLNFAGGQS